MAVWSQVGTSELVGAIRLDGEFWQPTYLKSEKSVRAGNHARLGSLVSTFKKGIFYILASEYAAGGIPFYRSSNVGAILPRDDGLTFITEQKQALESRTALKSGDLMIVKTGKSGASVVLCDDCNVSQDVIAVKVHSDRLNPYYLAVFLNTRFGISEMNRWFQGQVQPHLSLDDARRIWVALPKIGDQRAIQALVLGAAEKRQAAIDCSREAQRILHSHLSVVEQPVTGPVGYTASLSDVATSHRLDAEHFSPAFNQLASRLPPLLKLEPLGKHLSYCQRGTQPIYATAGLPVINSKHVQPNKVILDGNRRALPNPLPEFQIRPGDTLLNGTGRGTLGRAAPYLADTLAIPDNHVTILRSDTLDPAYLSLFLNSRAGQLQVEMHQRGTSGQLELYPFDIRRFKVWVAPESFQRRIRELHDQAANAERRSRELLEQAKTRVEQLIEEAAP